MSRSTTSASPGRTRAKPAASTPGVAARMSKQARAHTAPETTLRKLLHAAGLRYRVGLPVPGLKRRTIDVAFTKAKVAVFVDGCFWHSCPQHATFPAANKDWWAEKLAGNVARDAATTAHLEALGWRVIRVWEHEAPSEVAARVETALRQTGVSGSDRPTSERRTTGSRTATSASTRADTASGSLATTGIPRSPAKRAARSKGT
jgi:DNA mismatch endonuclease (patch repair protein)